MNEDTNLDDFVSLESLVDNPTELNKQMRLDLIRLVDSIRQQMMEKGSVGVQQQNQLVQALKMIKVLNQEIDKNDTDAGSSLAKLFDSLPFNDDPQNTVTKNLPFED